MNLLLNATRFASYADAYDAWLKLPSGSLSFQDWLFEPICCRAAEDPTLEAAWAAYWAADVKSSGLAGWLLEPSDAPMGACVAGLTNASIRLTSSDLDQVQERGLEYLFEPLEF